MGRWTYYSPLWLGVLLILSLNDAIRRAFATYDPWLQWTLVGLIAVICGMHCQTLMVGAQGAFAQVLPVPGGKSVRGGGAVAAGWLIIVWCVLAVATALLAMEQVSTAAMVVGAITILSLLSAGAIYAWNLPAATADFREDRFG